MVPSISAPSVTAPPAAVAQAARSGPGETSMAHSLSAPAQAVRKELFRSASELSQRLGSSSSQGGTGNFGAARQVGQSASMSRIPQASSVSTAGPVKLRTTPGHVTPPPSASQGPVGHQSKFAARSATPPAASAAAAGRVGTTPPPPQQAGTALSHQPSRSLEPKQSQLQTSEAGFERLAAGQRRDDIAKPKSLKAAEAAKLQEEKRQRERLDREQDRERERARMQAATAACSSQGSAAKAAAQRPAERPAERPAAAAAGAQAAASHAGSSQAKACLDWPSEALAKAKKAQRRSATMETSMPPPAAVPASEQAAPTAPAPAAVAALAGASVLEMVPEDSRLEETEHTMVTTPNGERQHRPSRSEDIWFSLRQIPLPPKLLEDNYEISDGGENSDEEHHTDRSQKAVPKWCENYLQLLARQEHVDPDSIFSSRVPQCHLDDVFTDEIYTQVGKSRPKRTRGSSGDWRRDRLTKNEVSNYKNRMGQSRSCLELLPSQPGFANGH